MTHNSGRGGKREGAGRPKGALNRIRHPDRTVRLGEWLTEQEREYLRELLKQRRAKEKEKEK